MCVGNGSTAACFMDWQKEIDRTKWAKLTHSLFFFFIVAPCSLTYVQFTHQQMHFFT